MSQGIFPTVDLNDAACKYQDVWGREIDKDIHRRLSS
jgi:hypothetical protein